MITEILNYKLYVFLMWIVPLMSIVDVAFTLWFLNRLKDKGIKNYCNREINPIGRYIFKKLGVGKLSAFVIIIYIQTFIIVLSIIYPMFIFIMYGALFTILSYHYNIYKEYNKFKNDKYYWKLVKHKLDGD